MIMLHKFDSNSGHTFFTLQILFPSFLEIVSCDISLVMTEHLTYAQLQWRKLIKREKEKIMVMLGWEGDWEIFHWKGINILIVILLLIIDYL